MTWYTSDDCRLDEFRAVVEQSTDLDDYRFADAVESNVLVYGSRLRTADQAKLSAELARALMEGPGIVAFPGAFDTAVVDRATEVFRAMIDEQRAAGAVVGDHFAKPGANDRVWGALDKFAVRA